MPHGLITSFIETRKFWLPSKQCFSVRRLCHRSPQRLEIPTTPTNVAHLAVISKRVCSASWWTNRHPYTLTSPPSSLPKRRNGRAPQASPLGLNGTRRSDLECG